ncbi:hypothetical protein FRC09_007536 [Ceratobasidium sp. 395]|nr:hypothetical protein FRC09_007536 [Ceratobasidium sp. 395]
MAIPHALLYEIACIFEQKKISLFDLIIALVQGPPEDQKFEPPIHPLLHNTDTSGIVLRLARNATTYQFVHELDDALKDSEAFQANASHITIEKVLGFSRNRLAENIKKKCPTLWQLIQILLNTTVARVAVKRLERAADYYTQLVPEASTETDVLDAASAASGNKVDEKAEWQLDRGRRSSNDKARLRQIALAEVRCVVIFSILMQSCNARCNGLQTMVAIFLHSTNTPERVIELLAHAGLAIAPSSINSMITAMSNEALRTLKTLLSDLQASIAYDNLDINFSTEQPTIEYSGHLAHITTGTFIPLRHATKEDLRVVEEIWAKSKLNPYRNPAEPIVTPTHKNLMGLLQSASSVPPESPLSIRSRMAWHIRDILLSQHVQTFAPALKEKLRPLLGQPAAKNAIPVVKTKQYPAQAMNVSVSTNSGNAVAIEKLLEQGGADKSQLQRYATLIQGDLGTGEKVDNLKSSRCIEENPVNRLQHVQFGPGLLHIEMAITDAMWKMYLKDQNPSAEKPLDSNTIFHLCSLACPRESKTLATGPDHHLRQHAIDNGLLAIVAEAWCNELFCRDALLWKMFKHSVRHGDVGSLEDLLPIWVCIWKHTGKHKYAEHITQFLLNLQQVWPQRFANVVRNNWLVNPTGKANGFRGVDWLVEKNNLQHKVNHGGSGSNRTVEHIVKESPLIEVYQQSNIVMEQNFHLTKSTLWHSPPMMSSTLAMLQKHVRERNFHSHMPGRKLSSLPINSIAEGLRLGTETIEEVEDRPVDTGVDGEDEDGSEGDGETDVDSGSAATVSDGDDTGGEEGTDGE